MRLALYWIGLAGPWETFEEAAHFARVAMLPESAIELVDPLTNQPVSNN